MVRLLLLLLVLAGSAAAQDRDKARLELVLDPREAAPLAGEMVLATLRGIYRQNITREEVKLRPMTDFDWVRLGLDSWTEERIDGLPARVFERRLAFYPRRDGTLEILPIAHRLEVLGAGGKRETVIVRSDPVTLTVAPGPAAAGQPWLPLRALELSESWDTDPARLADGQSATRRIVLRAFGATPEMMPQQPVLRQPWLISFAPPEERNFQVTPEGPVSTVVWTWKLRPITGEPGVIPPVTIPWFDTGSRTPETATISSASIGYASFSDNAAARWQSLGGGGWPVWALSGLAALVVVALSLRDRVPETGLRRRWQRRRLLRRLRGHVRARDAAGARRTASRLLEGMPPVGERQRLRLLRPADDLLYREGTGGSLELMYRETRDAVLRRPPGQSVGS
ncbi:Oxygen tolerance [Salipiger thiooxidans]|uniref:Oxygen tolerance n=1 Tax=Salipiger thiooxidans TaxID=282683 RepID=A0A1G7FQH6_9RHOB|nr:BatD family protein [Salipiger thiooxidans]SDE78191.1 Oxygen tolerance [Salipiger thiooxidans]